MKRILDSLGRRLMDAIGRRKIMSAAMACCYRQARDCVSGELIDVWANENDLAANGGFGAYCRYAGFGAIEFLEADPPSFCPGTVFGLDTYAYKVASCDECGTTQFGDCCKCGSCCFHLSISIGIQYPNTVNAGGDAVISQWYAARGSFGITVGMGAVMTKTEEGCNSLIYEKVYNGGFSGFLPVVYRERYETDVTCTSTFPTAVHRCVIERLDGSTWSLYATIYTVQAHWTGCCATNLVVDSITLHPQLSRAAVENRNWYVYGPFGGDCCRKGSACHELPSGYCETGECLCRCCTWRETLVVRFEDLVKCPGCVNANTGAWYKLIGDPNQTFSLAKIADGHYLFEGTVPGLSLEEYSDSACTTLVTTHTVFRVEVSICGGGISMLYSCPGAAVRLFNSFCNMTCVSWEYAVDDGDFSCSFAILDQSAYDACMTQAQADYDAAVAACGPEPEYGTPEWDAWLECVAAAEAAWYAAQQACIEDNTSYVSVCEGDLEFGNVDSVLGNCNTDSTVTGNGKFLIPAQ